MFQVFGPCFAFVSSAICLVLCLYPWHLEVIPSKVGIETAEGEGEEEGYGDEF